MDGKRIVVFGSSGCGKSTIMRQLTNNADRLIVFDPLPTRAVTASEDGLKRVTNLSGLKAAFKKKTFRIWYQPPKNKRKQIEALHELSLVLDQLQSPINDGKHMPPVTLVVDEASQSFPVTNLPENLKGFDDVCTTGRHYRMNAVIASQYPAQVNTAARNNASGWYFFQLTDHTALEVIRKMAGKEVSLMVSKLQPFEYVFLQNGKPTIGKTKP